LPASYNIVIVFYPAAGITKMSYAIIIDY